MLKSTSFTKAAIRTQPPDVIRWSVAYFTALANGDPLPVKRKLEPGAEGLSVGLLDVLHQQLKGTNPCSLAFVEKKWMELGLLKKHLSEIVRVGSFSEDVEINKFLAVAAFSSNLSGGNITDALNIMCRILTDDAEGGQNRITFELFQTLYKYLAELNGNVSQAKIASALEYLKADADKQGGMVMPNNFFSMDCPQLS
jgi:hypothetical protein